LPRAASIWVSTPSRLQSISLFQKTQYLEPFAGKAIVAPSVTPGMRIEIMLATVDLDDEAVFETDEIDDTTIERGLAPEVKSSFSP
jgi:hypothetical protein